MKNEDKKTIENNENKIKELIEKINILEKDNKSYIENNEKLNQEKIILNDKISILEKEKSESELKNENNNKKKMN